MSASPGTSESEVCADSLPVISSVKKVFFFFKQKTAYEMALVGMERDPAPTDLKAVRTGIGQALRTLHSDVLREEVPDRIAELLRQLDQQLRQLDQKDRDST